MNRIYKILGFFGFLLLLGTAGASDTNTLSFTHIALLGIAGLVLMLAGYYGSTLTKQKTRIKKKVHTMTSTRGYHHISHKPAKIA